MGDQDLVSVRNLVDSEFQTPLRRFSGVLDNYYPQKDTFATKVYLNYKDVEALKVAEGQVYEFPTAQIAIKLSNRKNSAWGVFGDSLAECIPAEQDIKDCIGKRMGLEMELGHVYGTDRQTGEELTGNPWKVYEVEGTVAGASATSAAEQALRLLDGKTLAEFNKEAYANPIIRKDTDLQRAITDKSFVKAMIMTEEFTKDDSDVYHRVAKEG